MQKVVLITGASKGFGRIWTEAILKEGNKVIATARNINALDDLASRYTNDLLVLPLDVTEREKCFNVVEQAYNHFGKIDVLINNAGYGLFGAIEETTEQEARKQMETNFFGTLWMTQAVLPFMRKQKSGHIIQISSYLGLVTLPILGLYNASKFAVEGLSETLASEVAGYGIHVTLVEPNGYATDWANASAERTNSLKEYDHIKEAFYQGASADIFGKPEATAEPIVNLIKNPNPPLRLLFGKMAYQAVKQAYQEKLVEFEKWKEVSIAAHGN